MTATPIEPVSDEQLAGLLEMAVASGLPKMASVYRELQSRRAAQPADRAAIVEECAKLMDLRAQDILLIAGEMSAQEMRSVRAMLNERGRAIRALKPIPAREEKDHG